MVLVPFMKRIEIEAVGKVRDKLLNVTEVTHMSLLDKPVAFAA